jgi:hypothetical protein
MKNLSNYNKSLLVVETVLKEVNLFLEQKQIYTEATISKAQITKAVETINSESVDGMKLDLKVVLSFAAGIQGFMGPAKKFFASGKFSSFSEQELIFLAIALVGSLQKKDTQMFKTLLNRIVSEKRSLKKIIFIARNIFMALMRRLHTVGSMGAFTVLLIPIMNALVNLTSSGVTSVNAKMIEDIILGMGINYSFYALGSGIKNTFIKLKNKFSSK